MKFTFVVLVSFSCSAFAGKSAKPLYDDEHRKGTGQYVYIHKSHVNKKRVREQFRHAQVADAADRLKAKRAGFMTLKRQRQFFIRTGLAKFTKRYDAFAKDILVTHLKAQPVSRLVKMYKKIPKATLANAKRRLPAYIN